MQPNHWQPFHTSYRWLSLGFALLFVGFLLWNASYPAIAIRTRYTTNQQNTQLLNNIVQIVAGFDHTCALTKTGSVLCWGPNGYGQLGDGTQTDRYMPVQVNGLNNGVTAITTGSNHTCALTATGNVKCWGDNTSGQLGNGAQLSQSSSPVEVSDLDHIVAISSGGDHTCALTQVGGIKCWGRNDWGQLGDGTTNERRTPVAVSGLDVAVTAITAGGVHTCALTTTGGVKCWGSNDNYQLGYGSSRSTPTDIDGLTNDITAIDAGFAHTCVLNTAGSVMCWGRNWSGQVGDGTSGNGNNRGTPTVVSGLSNNLTAIAAGGSHTCTLAATGIVTCWGGNSYGQLGNGTTTSATTPETVIGLTTDVTAITTGGGHTCALTTEGAVHCWGSNTAGRLGDGTATNHSTPVSVVVDSSILRGTPTPTPTPIFHDDFDQGTYEQWQVITGSWYVQDGALGALYNCNSGPLFRILAGDSSWSDYQLTFDIKRLQGWDGGNVLVRNSDSGHYWIEFHPNTHYGGKIILYRYDATAQQATMLVDQPWSINVDQWYRFSVTVAGAHIQVHEVSPAQQLVFDFVDPTPLTHGSIGFTNGAGAVCPTDVLYDNVEVYALIPSEETPTPTATETPAPPTATLTATATPTSTVTPVPLTATPTATSASTVTPTPPDPDNTWHTFTVDNSGLASNAVLAMLQSADGALWFVTHDPTGGDRGVSRLDPDGTWRTFTTADGLASNSIGPMLQAADGALWFGTRDGSGVSRLDPDGAWRTFTTADGLAGNYVNAMLQATDGALWFGLGAYNYGVSRLDPDGTWRTFNVNNSGLVDNNISAMLQAADGALWFGTTSGVNRLDPDGTWRTYTTADGLVYNDVRSMRQAADGALWFGSWGGGVSRLDPDGAWRTFTTANGFADNYVHAILQATDGALWFGTMNSGVSRLNPDGTWRTFTTADGLGNNFVRAMLQAADDALWFGTAGGGVSRFGTALTPTPTTTATPTATATALPTATEALTPTATPTATETPTPTTTSTSAATHTPEPSVTTTATATPTPILGAFADLAPTHIVVQGITGYSASVQWRIVNQGGLTAEGGWSDRLYLSQDNVLDEATDILLADLWQEQILTPGAAYTTTMEISLPPGTLLTDYLIVQSDYADALLETNEANNVFAQAFTDAEIPTTTPTPTPTPNLAATQTALAQQVATFVAATLTAQVTPSPTPTVTTTSAATPTPTITTLPTATPTLTATSTETLIPPTVTPTATATHTLESTATSTNSVTPTPEPTATSISTATSTSMPPTPTATWPTEVTPTATSSATATPVPTSATFYEPNDNCVQAQPVGSDGIPQLHHFETVADVDWAFFAVTANEQYLIEAQGLDDSPVDITMQLYATCATQNGPPSNPSFSPAVRVQFKAPSTGHLYLRLQNDNTAVAANQPYRLTVRRLTATTQPGLLILVAGRLKAGDALQSNIDTVAQNVYALFRSRGYTDDDIYLMAASNLPNRDATADRNVLYTAITKWTVQQGAGSDRPITLYLVDHGDEDKFYLDGVRGQVVSPSDLDTWLSELETAQPGIRINIFYEACFSGSFIQAPQSISKPGRVIVTSTTGQSLAYASRNGAEFSDLFLTGLRQGSSLFNSFQNAAAPVQRNFLLQQPWLDDNGNGIPNDPGDGQEAARRGFNFAGTLDNNETPQYIAQWPPYIKQAAVTELAAATTNRRLKAEVLIDKQYGDSIKDVWAAIYPPSFAPPTSSTEMVRSPLPPCPLIDIGNNEYAAQCSGFSENGAYQVIVYALSNQGLLGQPFALTVNTAATATPTATVTPTSTPVPPAMPTATPTATATYTSTPMPPTATPTGVVIDPTAESTVAAELDTLQTLLTFPPGAVTQTVTVVVAPVATPPATGSLQVLGHIFAIDATAADGSPVTHFAQPFTLVVTYIDDDVQGIDEQSLTLHYWRENEQRWVAIPTTVDAANNRLTATLDHLTTFAVLQGQVSNPVRLFLPLVLR